MMIFYIRGFFSFGLQDIGFFVSFDIDQLVFGVGKFFWDKKIFGPKIFCGLNVFFLTQGSSK